MNITFEKGWCSAKAVFEFVTVNGDSYIEPANFFAVTLNFDAAVENLPWKKNENKIIIKEKMNFEQSWHLYLREQLWARANKKLSVSNE